MASTKKPFRCGHLVRLCGFNHPKLDNQLARVTSIADEVTGKNEVVFLNDGTRPPMPVLPKRVLWVLPQQLQHACEHCLVVSATLMICGKCKTSQYCNAECQRADWARHKVDDCPKFGHMRGIGKPLPLACTRGDMAEVRRLVEDEGADVNKATSSGGPTPLNSAVAYGQVAVARYLLEKGAAVDKVDSNGYTPLHEAVDGGHLGAVECLVEHAANRRPSLLSLCFTCSAMKRAGCEFVTVAPF